MLEVDYECYKNCWTCLSPKYYHCTLCLGNRVLKKITYSMYGKCVCPDNTFQTFKENCEQDPVK